MKRGVMGLTAIAAICAIITASLGWFRVFSFVSALLILLVIGIPVAGNSRGSLFEPYTGLIVILGLSFAAGLGGIWLTWDPSVTEYNYVLGIPVPTLIYFAFIWLIPTFSALYYAFVFDKVASEEMVDDIIEAAREHQREQNFPLAVDQPEQETVAKGQSISGGDDDD